MSNKVSIELGVEQAQAVRAWLQNNQAIVQNTDALKALESASEKASKKSKSGFEAMASAALKTVGAYLSVQKVLELIGQEIETINRKNKAALDQQLGTAGTMRKAFDALHPASDMSPQQLEKEIQERSTVALPLSLATVTKALKEGGAGGSDRLAFETAMYAQKQFPHLEGELPELAAAAVDLQKQQPGLTPEQSVSQLGRLRRFSESSIGEISKDLVPAIARGRVLTGGKTDAGQLEAFYLALQDRMDVGIGEAVSSGETFLGKLSKQAGKPGMSLDELLAEAQGGKGKQLVKTMRDPKARGALMELLSGGETWANFSNLSTELSGDPEAVRRQEEARAAAIAAMPSQQTAEVQRRLSHGLERYRSDPTRALRGLEQEGLSEMLVESGVFGTQQKYEDYMKSIAPANQIGDLRRSVQGRRQQLEAFANNPFANAAGANMGLRPVPIQPMQRSADEMARENASIKILSDVEAALTELVELQREQMKTPQKVEVQKTPPDTRPGATPARTLSD